MREADFTTTIFFLHNLLLFECIIADENHAADEDTCLAKFASCNGGKWRRQVSDREAENPG